MGNPNNIAQILRPIPYETLTSYIRLRNIHHATMPQVQKIMFRSPHFAHPAQVRTAPLALTSRDFLLAELLFSSTDSIFDCRKFTK
ncbi:hypothetical protein WN943_018957 [Citrus x changshan-huyou]